MIFFKHEHINEKSKVFSFFPPCITDTCVSKKCFDIFLFVVYTSSLSLFVSLSQWFGCWILNLVVWFVRCCGLSSPVMIATVQVVKGTPHILLHTNWMYATESGFSLQICWSIQLYFSFYTYTIYIYIYI